MFKDTSSVKDKSSVKTGQTTKTGKRDGQGATLALVSVLCVIACTIGLAFCAILALVGGGRELFGATDSGMLSVAKNAEKNPGIKLTTVEEIENFGDLVDDNGLVTLRTYNRLVGRAILVGLNAQEQNTPAALDNAKNVLGLVQDNTDSIGKRLHDVLATGSKQQSAFLSTAAADSLRLVSTKAATYQTPDFAVSYMDRGGASNIYFDKAYVDLLPKGSTSAVQAPNGESYLAGYQPIDLGKGLVYYLVSLQPNIQPHLVSTSNFDSDQKQIINGHVPPNAFKTGASANHLWQNSPYQLHTISCAEAGTFKDFKPALPSGYIKVINPKGYKGTGTPPPGQTLYNDELAAGIYLGSDSQGNVVAFSLSSSVLSQWATYNQNGQVGQAPPLSDSNGNPYVFAADGSIAAADTLAKIGAIADPASGCNYANVSGPNGVPISQTCNGLLSAFKAAFPHPGTIRRGNPTELLAVEYVRDEVIDTYNAMSGAYAAAGATNAQVESATTCAVITAPSGYSGLKIFNHNTVYTNAMGGSMVSQPGTISQLLNQVGNGASGVIDQLNKKILQIKPEATADEISTLLASVKPELDSVYWIYMINPDGDRKLVYTVNPPPTLVTQTKPDGLAQIYSSGTYQTVRLLVDPIDADGWNHLFTYVTPTGGSQMTIYSPALVNGAPVMTTNWAPINDVANGDDFAIWTPSSGYNGLEGTLQFRNTSSGDGTFCGLN